MAAGDGPKVVNAENAYRSPIAGLTQLVMLGPLRGYDQAQSHPWPVTIFIGASITRRLAFTTCHGIKP